MQARPAGQAPARTFTETARRAQIVEAAIATICELGYRNASFAQIAKRAGLSSTGLISYHFGTRDELIELVVHEIVASIGSHMMQRLAGVTSAAAALRTYIEGNVQFIGANRQQMKALLEIFLNGGFDYGPESDQAVTAPIEQILRDGQRNGEFRDFDPKVMATLVQRAVDGLPFLLAAEPDLDVQAYGAEVATVFELATTRTT
ncbi:MAG TPA: TetR family transcriptional regulator [Streptosporangiaceae bacterium]|jgi:AcrR family transcriptional regulator|nr:TetR family transcriptional regulator [Streptosporangiaceae bacterium]